MSTPYRLDQIEERLGMLDGTRGRNPALRALRICDVPALIEFPSRPRSSKAADASPTKAEFDALVDDVHAIYRQMAALSEALRIRNSQ